MEERILLAIHDWSSPALEAAFRFSHLLGTLWFCVVLVLAAVLWHRSRGEPAEARLWLLLGLSTYVLQEGLKLLTARPRPRLWPWLVPADSSAFPSGHAVAAATFYPLLAREVCRRRPRLAPWAWGGAIALALYVGLGRLYLGVHWPTDVLAGWVLGAAQTAVGVRLARGKR